MIGNLLAFSFLAQAELETGKLTGILLEFARGGAEWILWLLVLLSIVSVIIFVERSLFLKRTSTDLEKLRTTIMTKLNEGDIDGALKALEGDESMEARVVAYGLRDAERGAAAVEDLCKGAAGMERLRYERGLSILATVGSNAPFIGLFGTVSGVIMAFDQLRALGDDGQDASQMVMGAIAEALIATGVGLLVAIPAIVFFNLLKGIVKKRLSHSELLVQTMVEYMRAPSTKGDD